MVKEFLAGVRKDFLLQKEEKNRAAFPPAP